MNFSFSIVGSKNIQKKLLDFSKISDEYAKKAVGEGALLIHSYAVKSIQAVSLGEIQVRYSAAGRARTVAASKPGDPPNTDTGRLVQSIQFEILESGREALVGTNLSYGKHLEFGTKKIAARPWLRPAIKKNQKKISKIFQKYFEKSKKDSTK